jgi:DNA uptake protein ComE-like DNA-binding protein
MNLKNIRGYFYIPKNERIISFVLLLILNSTICIIYLLHPDDIPKEILVVESTETKRTQQLKEVSENKSSFKNEAIIFVNELNFKDWIDLGFSEKQAKMILSYKKKIQNFRNSQDLAKVYCISDDFIDNNEKKLNYSISNKVRDVNIIKDTIFSSNSLHNDERELVKIDLNSCTQPELITVYGIGEVLSKRIIKYRDLLGGFVRTNQLKEVYGIIPENFEIIKERFVIKSKIRLIDINSASFKTLIRHPYLNKSHVNSILNYIKQHGRFKSKNDLKLLYSISDSIFVKIQPYILIKNE